MMSFPCLCGICLPSVLRSPTETAFSKIAMLLKSFSDTGISISIPDVLNTVGVEYQADYSRKRVTEEALAAAVEVLNEYGE